MKVSLVSGIDSLHDSGVLESGQVHPALLFIDLNHPNSRDVLVQNAYAHILGAGGSAKPVKGETRPKTCGRFG